MQTRSPEAKRAVDDGYLWPFTRPDMRDRAPIIERMVEDIDHLIRAGGDAAVVTQDDLVRKGWTLTQLEDYGSLAFAYYRAEHGPRRLRRALGRRDTIRTAAIEATALLVFGSGVSLWAGLVSGAL